MELRQLAYFIAVAEERNFTRAAERVMIAQPAISQQVRKLEVELGERLFNRDRRSVSLTAAGEVLLDHARNVLAATQSATDAVAALSGLLTGQLRLGLVQPMPEVGVLPTLGAFHRDHPLVTLTLVEDETDALLAQLRAGAIDIASIGLGPHDDDPPDLTLRMLESEQVVAALPSAHPLAGRRSLSLRSLRNEPFVTAPRVSKLRTNLEGACAAEGFTPRIVAEARSLDLVQQLVAQQIGVTVLPESAITQHDTLVAVPLTRPRLERRLILAARSTDASPAARAFLAAVSG